MARPNTKKARTKTAKPKAPEAALDETPEEPAPAAVAVAEAPLEDFPEGPRPLEDTEAPKVEDDQPQPMERAPKAAEKPKRGEEKKTPPVKDADLAVTDKDHIAASLNIAKLQGMSMTELNQM